MSGQDHDEDDPVCNLCGLGRSAHHPSHPSNPYVRSVHEADREAVPRCVLCDEPLVGSNLLAHPECKLRAIVGGIGHLTDHDWWCGQQGDPDAGHTYRESALLADEWCRIHGVHGVPLPVGCQGAVVGWTQSPN